MPSPIRKTASTLSQYLREIGATPLLNRQQEQDLARRIQDKDDETARQHLLKANLRLVVSIAKKYAPGNDPDMLMDLIQEGNLGLMKAVDRFKPDFGTRFSTYGVYWIKQAILRALKSRRLLRLPENVVDQVLSMQRTRQRLYQTLHRSPTSAEIAHEMNLALPVIHRLEQAATQIVSLERAISGNDDSDETQLRELLEDLEAPQPEQVTRLLITRRTVEEAVDALPARERKILELRFGLAGHHPHTLEHIGEQFGISRERVRQLQNSALSRLRQRQAIKRARE